VTSRTLWRRTATAAGVYSATILGLLISVVATRVLGTHDFGIFATVVAATGFMQLLMDLTIEEALVKYGFRYSESGDWGRFRRLFELALAFKLGGGLLGGIALAALAPFSGALWGENAQTALLIAALLPLVQAPEGVAAGAIILRGRYDIRGWFLAFSMAIRLAGVGIGATHGVVGATAGMVAAQVIATAAVGLGGILAFRRFPRLPSLRLGEHGLAFRNFVVSSTLGSSLVSARGTLGTVLLGVVAVPAQVAYFRNAQAPSTGLLALSAPARLVLMTEQTRDFERGRHDQMYGMLRRYMTLTTALMLAVVPLGWLAMPYAMGVVYGVDFRHHATQAARLVLVAAALQLIWGWTKSFPISIGRPNLRIAAHGLEVAVFVPLVVVFGSRWGATGAAGAMVVSTVAFCALWTYLLVRLRHEPLVAPEAVAS
jgi:O-antigen/teichoic acid export membrane protein